MCFWEPHAPFFDMEAKVPKMLSSKPNPFIDPAGYKRYIARWEKSYLEQVAKERTEAMRSCLRDLELKFEFEWLKRLPGDGSLMQEHEKVASKK